MDRARAWPSFRKEHVLYEDDDLIAVHKPAGVPSQSANPERPDDLVLRLREWLASRDGGGLVTHETRAPEGRDEPYLGVHQRLDRDTSGVVLFTKKKDVNAAIAKQFEGRTLTKQYLAAVTGWPERKREAKLDDLLRKGDGGHMEVVSRAGAGAQRAVTLVRIRTRKDDRTLLELRLETGRTHQARVQLAHAGAPIAGDPLYRGALAPRLMLHAAGLELDHPRTGKRLVIRDEAPQDMAEWIARGDRGASIYDDVGALDRALALATERRWGLGHSALRDPEERRTNAFRLVNEEGDALPGLAVDVYRDHLVAQLYVGGIWDDVARRDRVLDRLHALGFDGVYLKLRPKQANVLVDTRRDDLAPALPVRGEPAEAELTILEEGMPCLVRLGDGLSTGIFLDQRPNRRFVREVARGKTVLNLFSYTCAFSVAAALGGALRTVSVDASVIALERGRANFAAAGITLGAAGAPNAAHSFVAEDVFAWLTRAATKKDRFDIVIVDPPSYSSTKKRRFVAESDYDDLVALAAKVLAPHGQLLASCNHRGLGRQKLRRFVAQGMKTEGRELAQLKDLSDAPDFPPPLGRDPNMKSVLAVTL